MSAPQEIETASREALLARWQTQFNREARPRVHTSLLRRVLAWKAQIDASGFKPTALPVGATLVSHPTSSRSPVLAPGTRLLREWQGATHEVRVLSQGFEHAGQTYKSLSAIARAITGTPWSGPAFFAIKR